ncbi:conjugal transfer protein TraB [Streptomyces sp. NPDC020983]|uniref:conjugal transfer protein TraB n=1 Tax=Streptomyces sp. NPDC020983 TaxID=3365106 RepID=UPI0037AE7CA3
MSGEIELRGNHLPAIPDSELGFVSLGLAVITLTAQALLLKEKIWALQARMNRNADQTSNMSEMCDAAEVEPHYTALVMDGSVSLRRVAQASGDLVDAADRMQGDAQGFRDAHQSEYGGIYEAVQASRVQQPKPGFNEVK